jgi:zinc protease
MQKIFLSVVLLISSLAIKAQFKIPSYQKFTLKNGLTVYLCQQTEVPTISVNLVLPAGAVYDGAQAGLANFTVTALKHGTATQTKQQFDEALEFLGATINTYANKELAGISANFASKDKVQVLGMLQQLLLTPSFNSTEFDKEKKRALINLEQAKESPRSLMQLYFDKQIYGNHGYGNLVSGNKTTINALTVAQVNTFYKNHYSPKGAALAIVGNFDVPEIKTLITQLFGKWQATGTPNENTASRSFTAPTATKVLLVNRDASRETTFYIGSLGINRSNKDFVAVEVINTLFGGRFTSMLNDELRVNTGLTYGANSRFNALKNFGTFYISTYTATKTTEQAIDKALEVLKNLQTKGVEEKMLTSAKNYVKGQFPPRYETPGQLAQLFTNMFWYNLPDGFINDFEKNVDAIDMAKAKQIIATYFTPKQLQFVLIGKAADIKNIAAKYGPVTQVEVSAEIE